MGSEFTALMGDTTFDHDVSRIVFGDPESLRERIAGALEQMGYRVLNENPIQARHSARGSAKSGCSQNILNNGRSLDIGLKPAGPNATRVSFAYTIKGVYSGYLSKGDRNTLTREAEARSSGVGAAPLLRCRWPRIPPNCHSARPRHCSRCQRNLAARPNFSLLSRGRVATSQFTRDRQRSVSLQRATPIEPIDEQSGVKCYESNTGYGRSWVHWQSHCQSACPVGA